MRLSSAARQTLFVLFVMAVVANVDGAASLGQWAIILLASAYTYFVNR